MSPDRIWDTGHDYHLIWTSKSQQIIMLGIGEILFLASLIALLFGYKRIPKIGQYLVKTIQGYKEGSNEKKLRDVTPPKD